MQTTRRRGRGRDRSALDRGWLSIAALALALTGCPEAQDLAELDGGAGGAPSTDGLPPVQDTGRPTPDERVGGDADPPDAEMGDPCDPDPCAEGQLCSADGAEAVCTPADCATLECGPTEACEEVEGGAICVDVSCDGDLACAEDEYCDGVCVPDVCEAGARVCNGAIVDECSPNGSGLLGRFVCESPTEGFTSSCVEDVPGAAACLCRDAWDCPADLSCEGGRCQGTGFEATCRLDPVPFTESLPAQEIVWGGTAEDPLAPLSAFPESSQAVMTPVVANLDDDNGDGLVDERDFPEIIFMTFCNSAFNRQGVLRAIEGGGPFKGADKFAVLGPRLWRFGELAPEPGSYDCGEADLDPTASLAVGDLDDPETSDGLPEIVAVHDEGGSGIVIFDNTGVRIAEGLIGELNRAGGNPAVALANVDGRGPAEIVLGGHVITVGRTPEGALELRDVFTGDQGRGTNGQGAIPCVANVLGDPRPEIVAGGTVYAMPDPPPGAERPADCAANGGDIEPAGEDQTAWCNGELVIRWDAREANPDDNRPEAEGFCAVADILGATDDPPGPDNPPDGVPEVILIVNGALAIYDGPTGRLREHRVIQDAENSRGGAPNVDDFDGDGFPEVGSAFRTGYTMIDLQPPAESCPEWPAEVADGAEPPPENPERAPGGACNTDDACAEGAVCNRTAGECVCLHSGWRRVTEDASSRVTGSTLFDFNGDGAAEVIYNDECWFRIYDGRDGAVLFKEPSESRTRIENPIVADVDNDGNAEIAFTVSNESGFCSERNDPAPPPYDGTLASTYNNGLEVWGDPNDRWVSARRVWNQHAYHVTQVAESGRIPAVEPVGWQDYNGRSYNTYRSQPRTFGVAPDLTVTAVQFASPDAACGTLSERLSLSAQVRNIGDLRVGPGIVIAFEGIWDGERRPLSAADGSPIQVALVNSLEPGDAVRVTADYDITANAEDPDRLPDRIEAMVDAVGNPMFGTERECREDNNRQGADIVAPDPLPDLRMDLVTAIPRICPRADLAATITNTSEVPATDVVVRFYAGDPAQGAASLGEVALEEVGPGASADVELETDDFPQGRAVVVYAVVDPDERIEECNDGDNQGQAENPIACVIP